MMTPFVHTAHGEFPGAVFHSMKKASAMTPGENRNAMKE